jgi:hypothetical protein
MSTTLSEDQRKKIREEKRTDRKREKKQEKTSNDPQSFMEKFNDIRYYSKKFKKI